jgi:nucleoside-diphosphate-sugar epimerase
VTGGAGFIGSHLTDAFLARGDEVIVVDDLSAGSRDASATTLSCISSASLTRRCSPRSSSRRGRS